MGRDALETELETASDSAIPRQSLTSAVADKLTFACVVSYPDTSCVQISFRIWFMERREFLKKAAATTVVTSLSAKLLRGATDSFPYRRLGRSGEKVSLVGLGGHHIGRGSDEQQSIRIIRTALDSGINFLDNCWDYNGGVSEERMGRALRDGYRQKAFLMTKIDGRTRQAATQQLDESLRRLQTDRIDLLQFHEVIRDSDPARIFGEGGSMEALLSAREQGKIRYIGLSEVNAETIRRAHEVHPVTAVQSEYSLWERGIEESILPAMRELGIGLVPFSPLGRGYLAGAVHSSSEFGEKDFRRNGHGAGRRSGIRFRPRRCARSRCSTRRSWRRYASSSACGRP